VVASQAKTKMGRGRLTREIWIESVLDEMVAVGAKGLRIDALCSKLKVTKGSFYTHFSSKEDLLDQLIIYWSKTQPDLVIGQIKAAHGQGLEPLAMMLRMSEERNVPRRDAAIRDWARYSDQAAKALEVTDGLMLSFMEEVLRKAGLQAKESFYFARVLFLTSLGSEVAPWIETEELMGFLADKIGMAVS
jgi:AcrR family transcriptional regulator